MRIAVVSLVVLGVLALVCPSMAAGPADYVDSPALTIADQPGDLGLQVGISESEIYIPVSGPKGSTPVVPEPSSILALMIGVGGAVGLKRRSLR
ncbi:MAG: PEP-CTERM sorting domain-containing protein [Armatimonadota bacterium]